MRSSLSAHVPALIARRAVPCPRARDGAELLAVPGYFVAVKTIAKLQSTGSFPFVTQSNIRQFFTLPDVDVAAGDVVLDPSGAGWILYTDFSHAVASVPAYIAFFALRVNLQDVVVYRYAGTPGPAGGINKDRGQLVVREISHAHFYRPQESTASVSAGLKTERSDNFIVVPCPASENNGAPVIAPGDLVTIASRDYEFTGEDSADLPGINVFRIHRVK